MSAVSIVEAHNVMTHHEEADTMKMFKYIGIPIKRGVIPPFVVCGLAKARRKNFPTELKQVRFKNTNVKTVK